MIHTSDLIESLVTATMPIRRLPSPWARTGTWLVLAVALTGMLALVHGLRPDFAVRMQQSEFRVSLLASLLTGALAALAALMTSLPDRSRVWLLLPVPTAVLWMSAIGYGCLTDWVRLDTAQMHWDEVLSCFLTLLLSSVPLSALMFWMIRHAARLRPRGPILCAGAAVAALTATALSLLHQFDASIMILLWNFGTVALVTAVDTAVGRRVVSGIDS